jgi:glycosyltransferase involved in cell wall biosynthesis
VNIVKSEEALISVIVAIYNVEEYLLRCVNSIINQSYKNIEIILVDDGSTDSSGKICDSFETLDNRVKVIHKKNGGLVSARKAGLEIAKGEYVIFVDADDYLDEMLCQEMYVAIAEEDLDFVHSNYYENEIHKSDGIKEETYYSLDNNEKIEFIKDAIFEGGFALNKTRNVVYPGIWSKIFKIDFIKKCYHMVPDNQSYGEDLICLCSAIIECKSMKVIDTAFYHYCIREESMSHSLGTDNIVKVSNMFFCLKKMFETYGCLDKVNESLDKYFLNCILKNLKKFETKYFHINRFSIGNVEALLGKKVIIYGAGEVGRDYYDQLSRFEQIDVVGVVDSNYKNIENKNYSIDGLYLLKKEDFDFVIIAVADYISSKNIIKNLCDLGIRRDKLIWSSPILSTELMETR